MKKNKDKKNNQINPNQPNSKFNNNYPYNQNQQNNLADQNFNPNRVSEEHNIYGSLQNRATDPTSQKINNAVNNRNINIDQTPQFVNNQTKVEQFEHALRVKRSLKIKRWSIAIAIMVVFVTIATTVSVIVIHNQSSGDIPVPVPPTPDPVVTVSTDTVETFIMGNGRILYIKDLGTSIQDNEEEFTNWFEHQIYDNFNVDLHKDKDYEITSLEPFDPKTTHSVNNGEDPDASVRWYAKYICITPMPKSDKLTGYNDIILPCILAPKMGFAGFGAESGDEDVPYSLFSDSSKGAYSPEVFDVKDINSADEFKDMFFDRFINNIIGFDNYQNNIDFTVTNYDWTTHQSTNGQPPEVIIKNIDSSDTWFNYDGNDGYKSMVSQQITLRNV